MIGIFDSGLGGLTVVREVFRQLPGYDTVYLGDTARMPYGNKSARIVTSYAIEDARFLVRKGAKVIVVACNTASALAIRALREKIQVPVIEVVTPAVAGAHGRVGVIGTRATVRSGVYERRLASARPGLRVAAQECPLFVPLVEEGIVSGPVASAIARTYLRKVRSRGIDTLILGCTHYPFLRPTIRRIMGPRVTLIDPAREAVAELRGLIGADEKLAASLPRKGSHRFFVTDLTANFRDIASRWLGRPVRLAEVDIGS